MTNDNDTNTNLNPCAYCGTPTDGYHSGSYECGTCWSWRKTDGPAARYWGTFTPIRVSGVSIYGAGPMRDLPIRQAAEFVASNGGDNLLILGAMRPGYLGREMLTLADLDRWVHEDDDAAEWAYIADCERVAGEMGMLR